MDWADKEDWLLEVSQANNFVPSAIRNKPELTENLNFIWYSFQVLSGSRQSGYGILQAITLNEIKSYIELYEIEYDTEIFVELIQYMDSVFLQKVNKKK